MCKGSRYSSYDVKQLIARHDPLQMLLDKVMGRSQVDSLKLQVTLQPGSIDPCVLALLSTEDKKKRDANGALLESRWDLGKFAKPCSVPGMPKDLYMALADAPELMGHIWANPKLRVRLLEKSSIEQIILSDLPRVRPATLEDMSDLPLVLTVSFQLPDLALGQEEIQETLSASVEFLVELIDTLGSHGRLSADVRFFKILGFQSKMVR